MDSAISPSSQAGGFSPGVEQLAQDQVQVAWVGTVLERGFLGDDVLDHQGGQRLIHRLHLVVGDRLLDLLVESVQVAHLDQLRDPRRPAHDLDGGDETVALLSFDQLQRDDRLEHVGQLQADLLVVTLGEAVDDAVDGLGRTVGVQRREDQVSGLGGGEDGLGRRRVAHLADHDHVGVLAQHVTQGDLEARRVVADLALTDRAATIGEQELDRVLDGHDVHETVGQDLADRRGERRGLARAGRAGDQHQPLGQPRELVEDVGEAPLIQGVELEGNATEDRRQGSALHEVGAAEAREPPDAVAEVDGQLVVEPRTLHVVQRRLEHPRDVFGGQRGGLERQQLAVEPDQRRSSGLQMKIGGVLLDGEAQQIVNL